MKEEKKAKKERNESESERAEIEIISGGVRSAENSAAKKISIKSASINKTKNNHISENINGVSAKRHQSIEGK